LSDKDEAVGAQGIPLTPGRSIAVDKSLHVYGTPFFIEGELPIESEESKTPFRRLMIAQDTGSAITGPARADLYFGAGADAGKVAGRLRQNVRFVMLVPKRLDPQERAHKMPLPDPRPSEKIAKLVPQTLPMKDTWENEKDTAPVSASAVAQAQRTAGPVLAPVPLPEARPASAPSRDRRHHSHRGRP
jgi:membrane-bound lytic murein transglycosylase A